jgi:hypothetical protein
MHRKTMAIINDTAFPLADANGNITEYVSDMDAVRLRSNVAS